MFAIAITAFFFVGGLAATLIRIELATPQGDVVSAETYNKLFTLHGIVMVWFFLIPSIPTTLGNFLLPIMVGARDLAFPRLNLASFYIYVLGGIFTLVMVIAGGVDTGWTFYTPYSTMFSNSYVLLAAAGVFIVGFSSIFTGLNFIVTVHTMRAPGMRWFRLPLFVWAMYSTSIVMVLATPVLAMTLALIGIERIAGVGFFDPALGGDPVLVPASVLVLFASGRLHHGVAGDGRRERDHHLLRAQTHLRLQVHGVCNRGHRGDRISGMGPSHVRGRRIDVRRIWFSRC